MEVICFSNFPVFACNTYLLIKNNRGLIIDPGYFSNEMKRKIAELDGLDGILITHQHFDHIRGLEDLNKEYPNTPIYANLAFGNYINKPRDNLSLYMTPNMIVSYNINVLPLKEGRMNFNSFDVEVLLTPGHSKDSVSFIINNNFFMGDTLFIDSVGRYDFPNSSYSDLLLSINKIRAFIQKSEFNCYFGHGDNCSSSLLKRYNPYLK